MKIIGKVCTLICCVSLVFIQGSTVFSYALFGSTRKLYGGINNRYYYIDSYMPEYYKARFKRAFTNWYNTPTSFNFSSSTYEKSVIDCYVYNKNDNSYGRTSFVVHGRIINAAPTDVWDYASVYLNTYNLSTNQNAFNNGIAGHEIGHAIGLAHVNNRNVLMHPYGDEVNVTTPQNDEVNGVNYLYK